MQKYERIKNLPSRKFRRLIGVSKSVFQDILNILKITAVKKIEKGGRPSSLVIEDRLLMALEYLREYRTYFHLGQSYGVSESSCYKTCKWVENTLIKDPKLRLPGKKVLLKTDIPLEMILIDAAETPIERPKKKRAA
ncbi:MAG: transposase [Verrucomicrobia bacterium RIFCSPHIGHO2_12_FULL_41_10]|nr:MAG: transposase [Verrucomicrobia bacterium RIFCSPHIGHO2_12_FULL_41_10]